MLIEQGALRQSGRGWSLEKRLDLPMPDSVHAVIANRVDLLDPRTAPCCSPPPWWACSSGRARSPRRWAARSSRSSARCAGWSSATSCTSRPTSTMAGQPEFRFRHVLVRDVCYQRLPRTERVARHERTADWLDALSRSRDTDLAEVLAHHRWAAHEIARTLGVDTARYAPAGARRAAPGGPPGVRPARPGRRRRATSGAPWRWPTSRDPVDRLQLELLGTEISFYRDRRPASSPAAAPTS